MAEAEAAERIDWTRHARKHWRAAVWIHSDGPFAVLTHCRVLTVELADSRERAEKIASWQCGGRCHGDHEIVDMREEPRRGRR